MEKTASTDLPSETASESKAKNLEKKASTGGLQSFWVPLTLAPGIGLRLTEARESIDMLTRQAGL